MSERVEIKNLENVKIGDEFAIEGRYNYTLRVGLKIVTCTHVTRKQATIGDTKYWKHNAYGIGGKGFNAPPSLYEATPEVRLEIKKFQQRLYVTTADLKELGHEEIEQIYKILKSFFNKK